MTKHKALMGGFFGIIYKKKMKGGYSLLILKLVMNGLKYLLKSIPLNSVCFASAMCPNCGRRAAKTKVKNEQEKSPCGPTCVFLDLQEAKISATAANQREIIIGPGQPPVRCVAHNAVCGTI